MNINLEFEFEKGLNTADLVYPYTLVIKMRFRSKNARGIASNLIKKTLKEIGVCEDKT
jgi:hypothetical protein